MPETVANLAQKALDEVLRPYSAPRVVGHAISLTNPRKSVVHFNDGTTENLNKHASRRRIELREWLRRWGPVLATARYTVDIVMHKHPRIEGSPLSTEQIQGASLRPTEKKSKYRFREAMDPQDEDQDYIDQIQDEIAQAMPEWPEYYIREPDDKVA